MPDNIDNSKQKRVDRESEVWKNKYVNYVVWFGCAISFGNLLQLFILQPINIWYAVVAALCNIYRLLRQESVCIVLNLQAL